MNKELPIFHEQHYIKLAQVIEPVLDLLFNQSMKEYAGAIEIISTITIMFGKDNPDFDGVKFCRDCGLEAEY